MMRNPTFAPMVFLLLLAAAPIGAQPAHSGVLQSAANNGLELPQRANPFDLGWYSIDAGGGIDMTAGFFVLSGTLGQSDGTVQVGGSFVLVGGFLAVTEDTGSTTVFRDGFESGDSARWTYTIDG